MLLCCSETEKQVWNSGEMFGGMLVGREAVNPRVRKSQRHQYLTSMAQRHEDF